MMIKTRYLFLGAALIAAVGFTVNYTGNTQVHAETPANTIEAENQIALDTAEFAIENMTCATCPVTVRKAIARVSGVQSVKVDFATKIATVEYDPALTSPADIAAAPTANGYPATLVGN